MSFRSCTINSKQFPTDRQIIHGHVSIGNVCLTESLAISIDTWTTSHLKFRLTFRSSTTSTDWQHVCRLSFIENQIKICEAIQSPMELQYWYAMLGSHLASHGTEKRIRFLLDDLLGPTHSFVDLTKVPDRSILVSARFRMDSHTIET